MKRYILFLVLLVCLSNHLGAVYFKHIGIQEGLSQVSVIAIYQDKLGRMWFGTEEGVNMYDGKRTITYKSSEYNHSNTALPIGNQTLYITGDEEGNIFFDSDHALIRYDIRTRKFTRLKDSGVQSVDANNGTIWIGSTDSIYTWDAAKEQLRFIEKLPQSKQYATCFKEDSKGQIWIGTTSGLFLKKGGAPMKCVIPNEEVYRLFEDSKQNLWISTRQKGLYKRNKSGNMIHLENDPNNSNSISDNQVRGIAEDNLGNIWIGTFRGLNKYDPKTGQYEVYTRNHLPGSITHSSIFPIYKDKQGTIWVGTYYGGVNYFNPETDLFSVYTDNPDNENCLSHPFVGHMIEDKEDNIWICTEGGGLNLFNRKTKKLTHFQSNNSHTSVAQDNLKDIAYDAKRNKLYIATHTGGLSIYDIKQKRFRNPYFESVEYANRAKERINRVGIWENHLLFTTPTGIFQMDLDTEQITYLLKKGEYPNHTCFTIDAQGYLWLAYIRGVWRINLKNPKERIHFPSGKNGLGEYPISTILTDQKDRIFFATRGSGLYQYDPQRKRFIGYNTQNSLIGSNYCYTLKLSTTGQIIISDDKGLTLFNPDTHTFKLIELGNALPLAGINLGCGLLVCRNGEVFVGGINGMATFFEQQITQPAKNYEMAFSDLYINNELVEPGDHNNVLDRVLPYTRQIICKHSQNNLIITFTSNNYANTLKETNYEYQLKGFNNKWIDCNDNAILYTNLSPGKYTLMVREKQFDPKTAPQMISMEIVIRYPWYATPLAYCIYLLLLGIILYSIYRSQRAKFLLQNSLELERHSNAAIESLNQAKLQFFANISHEFRTPLTLIMSQIELLLQNHALPPTIYNKLLKAHKNSQHMQNLITELLDFRKLEQGHMKLKVSEQDIVPFLKEIYLSFHEYAEANDIHYQFYAPQERLDCWFDPKQLQKVFYNLLSNAFKYNKPHSAIEMVVENEEETIIVKVIDNGVGIGQEDIEKIFNRFYQVEAPSIDSTRAIGTGIGLSLAKGIVELHRGTISVESTPGYGSIFIVLLHKGDRHFSPEELIIPPSTHTSDTVATAEGSSLTNQLQEFALIGPECTEMEKESESSGRTILLVEDNEELLQILASLFEPTYRVVLARNGKEGLQKTQEEMPDIIVSDVMMPEMSGTEMCTCIKNNFNTSHIPVVLLTALTSIEQNIEGLQRGADDYIRKPFNTKMLLARCNNLVRGRIILQKKFAEEKGFSAQTLADNPIDQKFLDAINAIIEENISNEEFDINMMARQLLLSRSSLYSKFKSLTGMTPNDYILNLKLKRAAMLLTERPDLQIADVACQIGFGSPRYFTRCFKAQFKVSPAEYRKQETPGHSDIE